MRGTTQVAYRLRVASSAALVTAGIADVWDSGRVESADNVLIPCESPPLQSRQRAHWSVQVWDRSGATAASSEPAWWEMGLLRAEDWHAQWIAPHRAGPAADEGRVSYLRSSFFLPAPVHRARAYATALGLYELHCNGTRVGAARFTPGWTDYPTRLQYQVLDLDDVLRPGENVIGAVVAEGWYAGYIGFQGQREHYGSTPQLLVQVEAECDSGLIVHSTGAEWSAGTGPIRRSDMLRGEEVDARLDNPDWCRPGPAQAERWAPTRLTAGTDGARRVSPAPPVRVLRERAPVAVTRTGRDVHRIDVGQNMVGWLRLRLSGAAGSVVLVRHAEVLEDDGALHVANLRGALATETYVLAGGSRLYEPSFTFHGFRYAEVSGYEEVLAPADVTAVVCGSDVEQVGSFTCSEPRVDRLHDNIAWGARGNFFDVPTDCPQRDERLGWTGDAQVFAPTAVRMFDMAGFFAKWIRDLTDTQTADGVFADVAPRVVLEPTGSAGWADAGVLVPWTVYRATGDRRLLEDTYPAMLSWIRHLQRANPDLLWLHARGYDNGDWLAPGVETDKDLIASAFFAHSARTVSRVAHEIDRHTEAEELRELAESVRVAFCRAHLTGEGRLSCETQTAYALALRFDLLPERARDVAARWLAEDVERRGHLTTGFLGVAHLLPALTSSGRNDLAYRLLLRSDHPSWLHAVDAGGTTIWERWDGWTAEAGLHDPAMNSFNHYAFGAVGEWLYSTVGGIHQDAPDGSRLLLAPRPGPGITAAEVEQLTPKGRVSLAWEAFPDSSLRVEARVPVGATAVVRLPAAASHVLLESQRSAALADHVRLVRRDPDAAWLEVASGAYDFRCLPERSPAADPR